MAPVLRLLAPLKPKPDEGCDVAGREADIFLPPPDWASCLGIVGEDGKGEKKNFEYFSKQTQWYSWHVPSQKHGTFRFPFRG